MSLSKRQKLKVLSKDPFFSQKLAYIEKLSLQLKKITGETKFTLRTEGKIAWFVRISICNGCSSEHDFALVLKLPAHCAIPVPTLTILKYKRECTSTQYIIQKFYYSASHHLDVICGAFEQVIVDALGEKARFLNLVNNSPAESTNHRFSTIELKGG